MLTTSSTAAARNINASKTWPPTKPPGVSFNKSPPTPRTSTISHTTGLKPRRSICPSSSTPPARSAAAFSSWPSRPAAPLPPAPASPSAFKRTWLVAGSNSATSFGRPITAASSLANCRKMARARASRPLWATASINAFLPLPTPIRVMLKPSIASSRTSSTTWKPLPLAPTFSPRPLSTNSTSTWPDPIPTKPGSHLGKSSINSNLDTRSTFVSSLPCFWIIISINRGDTISLGIPSKLLVPKWGGLTAIFRSRPPLPLRKNGPPPNCHSEEVAAAPDEESRTACVFRAGFLSRACGIGMTRLGMCLNKFSGDDADRGHAFDQLPGKGRALQDHLLVGFGQLQVPRPESNHQVQDAIIVHIVEGEDRSPVAFGLCQRAGELDAVRANRSRVKHAGGKNR